MNRRSAPFVYVLCAALTVLSACQDAHQSILLPEDPRFDEPIRLPGVIGGEGPCSEAGWMRDENSVCVPPPPPTDENTVDPRENGGGSGGGTSEYEQGPIVWAVCALAVAGSTYSVWDVADEFENWYGAYKDASGAQRLWQATVQNRADPYIQQLYEYQYKQARQRQEDAKGAVEKATGASAFALAGAALACGATLLIGV